LGNFSSILLAAEVTEECTNGMLKNNGDINPKLEALMHAYLPLLTYHNSPAMKQGQ
jgi:hypothetical protein